MDFVLLLTQCIPKLCVNKFWREAKHVKVSTPKTS